MQLDQSAAFLESILTSMKAAVVVVGPDLMVRAWSTRADELWGVRPHEAQKVHVSNLDIGLPLDGLLQPIRECLAGSADGYDVTLPATNRRGKAIMCRVTLSPLREPDGAISGVVMLMDEVERSSPAK
jgi:two-component system CheB/CheR fusion protein